MRNVVVIVLRGFCNLADFEGQNHRHDVPNVCELLRNIFCGCVGDVINPRRRDKEGTKYGKIIIKFMGTRREMFVIVIRWTYQ